MIVNQASLKGLDIAYSTAFNQAFAGVKDTHDKFATTVPSSTGETNYTWLGQMPGMREWIGERTIQNISAYDYTIKNKNFESTISIPRNAIEDDQYGQYSTVFAAHGEEAARHPNILCYEVLKNGFSEKCFDGKTFFAEDHPSGKDGKVKASNLSKKKFSEAEYEKARKAIMMLTGDKGQSLGLVPDLLVVSPANEKAARLVLEADQINGTTNVLKGTAELLVAPELADKENCWFLLCTNRFLKPIIFQDRKKAKLTALIKDDDENVFMRNEFIWGVDARYNAGYGFWQMAYGSTGTEA